MLYKEFISALVMTGIVTAFAIPMTQLSGESQVVPLLLLICMGIFNVGQYILAGLRYAAKIDVKMTMRGYPLRRVAVLFVLTVLYLLFLETLGFYIGANIPLFHRRLAHRPAHEDHAEACRQACRRLLRLHRLLVLPVHRTAGRSDP